jgi:hypothetical protein
VSCCCFTYSILDVDEAWVAGSAQLLCCTAQLRFGLRRQLRDQNATGRLQ